MYSDVNRKAPCWSLIVMLLPTFVVVLFAGAKAATLEVANTTRPSYLPDNIEVPDKILLLIARYKNNSPVELARQSTGQNVSTTPSTSSNRRCSCANGICKCCTGYVMDLLNQKACMKVMYHPGDFAFDVAMSLNDRVLYENSLSGKNPRPICISPPRLNNLKVCARFYNVFFPGRNFHFCLAMEGKWGQFELFNFAFDCLRMGANGVAMVGPDEGGGLPIANPQGGVDAVIDSGDDIEDYDENVVRSLIGDLFDDDEDEDDDDDDDE